MGRTFRKMSRQEKEKIKRKKRQRQYGDDYNKPKKKDEDVTRKKYNDR